MDKELLNTAYQEWQSFVDSLQDESNQRGLVSLDNAISANTLHYLASIEDATRFDQAVNKLPNSYLHQEELVPTIYRYYQKRGLQELAHDYIVKTVKHYVENGSPIPTTIQPFIDDSESVLQLNRYQISLERIRNLPFSKIPFVTPEGINNQREIGMFLLNEIIQAANVMIEKIEGVRTITHEDRFNDLLLAILRLRFPVWGWSIIDQSRSGTAAGGKNAGEVDIAVQSGGNTISLIEALILTGRDKTITQKHVSKVFRYNQSLDRYYMLVYYRGKSANLTKTWESYKTDASTTSVDPKFVFDVTHDFKDLSDQFENVNHLKIAKSIHGTKVEMYHVMIDLSS
jgi:hypothetical protein